VRFKSGRQLAASPGPTTTVKSISTTSAWTSAAWAASFEAAIRDYMAAIEAASFKAASSETTSGVPAVKPAAVSEAARIKRTSEAVVPRASAYEDSAREPARTVVPVRRASIRIVGIVAIRTDRRSSHVTRPNADADSDPDLGLRISDWQSQQSKQRKSSQCGKSQRLHIDVFHGEPPFPPAPRFRFHVSVFTFR
jgi:hypothetical protein